MHHRRAQVTASLISLLLVGAIAAACVRQAGLPADCDASAVQRDATLAGTGLSPDAIDVCRDQRVTLDIATQVDGEIHLHGYDQEAPAIEVQAGDTAHFVFAAVRSGQFIIELHSSDGEEVEVGLLTVHEP